VWVSNVNARSATSSARKDNLSYKLAAIDIHTKVRMVVVAAVAKEGGGCDRSRKGVGRPEVWNRGYGTIW
jgi:hypothetical protein